MQQAAQVGEDRARSRRRSSEGEEAEQQLEPLGDDLQEEREQMAQDWRDEVVQQLDQALADAEPPRANGSSP